MSFLGRFRITPKFLSVIFLMAGVAGLMAYLGISSIAYMNEAEIEIADASNRSIEAARLSQNIIALNRSEFRVALDPRAENQAAARTIADEQLKLYNERFEKISQTKDERARAMMPAIKDSFAAYKKNLDGTFKLAEAAKDGPSNELSLKLRDHTIESRALAEDLLVKVRAASDAINDRMDRLSRDSKEHYDSAYRQMIVYSVSGVLLGLVAAFLIGEFGIGRPLRNTVLMLESLAAGNFGDEVTGTERNDEIGEMARAALTFKQNGLEKIRMEAEQRELETFTAAQRKRDMVKLADDFEGAVGEIINTVSAASTELETSATSLTTVADRSQQVAVVVAAASEEATVNVQSVAASAEQMASSVNEISRQVQESSRIASEAVEQARNTNERVGELSEAAARIGAVVELITTIAGQTNLLALNATIEAARAGDAGRGFAVVASEVKALAEQTTKATGQISEQINSIQVATSQSVTAIRDIGNTIGKMSEIASTIASAVEEQGVATRDISRSVDQATTGTMRVSSNIVDVQRGTGETGSASAQVLAAAKLLSQDSDRLKLEVGRFLATVRAA